MRHLLRTTAILLATGGFALTAQAQDSSEPQLTAGSPSYCDMPWVQVDENSDGFVSQEEATGAVDSQFGAIDADGNGEITKTEYVDCKTRTGGQAAAESSRDEQNFAEADANKDSGIDRNEFRDQARQAYDDSQSAADDEQALVVLRRFIWLTPEEARDASALNDMSADEVAGRSAMTFAALDQNDDDIIDTMEWSERSPPSRMTEEWASAQFDELDSDATGSISQDEYKSARSKMLDETTTGSTDQSGASESTGDQKASESGSDAEGVPVFVYRFLTF